VNVGRRGGVPLAARQLCFVLGSVKGGRVQQPAT